VARHWPAHDTKSDETDVLQHDGDHRRAALERWTRSAWSAQGHQV